MLRMALRVAIVALVLVSWSQHTLAAGACAAPAITNAAVDTTNGPWTCHINDAGDKVEMQASATDNDDTSGHCPCLTGNRIDLAATTWAVSDGTLDAMTGATNKWKAGNTIGSKTLTVTFKDKDDGADCDDDDVEVQKTLIAFKVGVHLATSGGRSGTWWEDTTPVNIGFGGDLTADHILTSNPNPATGGASSVATWTLKTDPADTPMKQNIHAKAHVIGYGGGEITGLVDGVTADSDWDDDGQTSLSIGVSAGLVSFSASHTLDDDDNVSTLAAGAAFGSELHTDYTTCKIELESSTETGPADKQPINHSPADAVLIGGHDASKKAEWEIHYNMEKKTSSGNWAAAEVDIEMSYQWTVTNTMPWYAP